MPIPFATMNPSLQDRLLHCVADARVEEPLSNHTTVQVGGPAEVMLLPADQTELSAALRALREEGDGLECAVVGGGANLFADSAGWRGVVISLAGWRWDLTLDSGLMVVGGGLNLADVAREAARQGWGGVDFMAVVPGTVGGAVVINAGTIYEGYVADRFEWAETVDREGRLHCYARDDMGFGYRASRLLYGKEIVTRTAFRLAPCEEIGRGPEELLARFDEAMAKRWKKFPLDLPNFGSTFRSPGEPHPPAGKLIDDLGLKGHRVGNARISDLHGNFIVNLGGASSDDILGLMQVMHDAVHRAHDVCLRPEVHYLCNRHRPRPDFFPAAR
ncbi:UDP-N-acetylmuramate dehydrogenase [bacterium]|nr:UDP-N-acetylmuramate dehydrogenase [bacterium]